MADQSLSEDIILPISPPKASEVLWGLFHRSSIFLPGILSIILRWASFTPISNVLLRYVRHWECFPLSKKCPEDSTPTSVRMVQPCRVDKSSVFPLQGHSTVTLRPLF